MHNFDHYKKKLLYTEMLRIRIFEEQLAKYYKEQEMRCPTHFSIGQEAVAGVLYDVAGVTGYGGIDDV